MPIDRQQDNFAGSGWVPSRSTLNNIVMGDCFSGNMSVVVNSDERQKFAASWAHARRKVAESLRYFRNQWDALNLYVTDGRLPLDNNAVEQLMKQVAMGRKAWLVVRLTSYFFSSREDFVTEKLETGP